MTKRELQSLGGLLSFASTVVKAGRSFSRGVYNLLGKVKRNNHFVRLNSKLKDDLRFWKNIVGNPDFNGKAKLLENDASNMEIFVTDSSFYGYGVYYDGNWLCGAWDDDVKPYIPETFDISKNWCSHDISESIRKNINALELFPILQAARSYGHLWKNKRVIVYTDNTQCMAFINNGTCKGSSEIMTYLRELLLISAYNNFHLTARYIKGNANVICDCLSRLNDSNMWHNLINYVSSYNIPFYLQMKQNNNSLEKPQMHASPIIP